MHGAGGAIDLADGLFEFRNAAEVTSGGLRADAPEQNRRGEPVAGEQTRTADLRVVGVEARLRGENGGDGLAHGARRRPGSCGEGVDEGVADELGGDRVGVGSLAGLRGGAEAVGEEGVEERREAQSVVVVERVLGMRVERLQKRPERGAAASARLDVRGDGGEEVAHELELVQETERRGGADGEEAQDFLEQAGRGGVVDFGVVAEDGLLAVAVQLEAELRGEAHGAHHPHGVFAEADVRVADGAQDAALEVLQPADVVDHVERLDVVKEPVDGEVAALGVLLGGAEEVVLAAVEGAGAAVVLGLGLVGLAAEGARLDLAVLEADEGEAEAAADEVGVAEELLDLARIGVCRDIEVLGLAPHEQVADAAADEVGDEPGVGEAVEDAQRLRGNVLAGNAVLGPFANDGARLFFAEKWKSHVVVAMCVSRQYTEIRGTAQEARAVCPRGRGVVDSAA